LIDKEIIETVETTKEKEKKMKRKVIEVCIDRCTNSTEIDTTNPSWKIWKIG
jgi:hypothetical protein